MSSVKSGIQIFKILVEHGQLDRDDHSDLFIEYLNSEVQEVLSDFEEEMDCKIIKLNNSIYLLPNFDNSLLGFRNKDFRSSFGSGATNSDVYLSYYITMFLLHQFYGGKNQNPKQRDFIRVMTLIDDLDQKFEAILSTDEEDMIAVEEELNINLIRIAEVWNQKIVHEENKRSTKYGTVIRICSLLEQEKLIRLLEDKKEIRTTKKLDDLMTYYFLNDSRIQEINSIFKEEPVHASN
ncbi:hypothetical protein CIB95_11740 [Lottiidibacillus patelloidae]|uniref:Non-ribosomal peptide synthetase module n=1 Tax=Lottiidibacillus patelloidae TaxID=2670334 RepID=A0A263BRV3_9BACI|nr:DUF6063 family protein [Lottiidibacillus patelloidae]OZM56440.1 hypothetical protein CIB95_11740 [Lottiidibacillus patelloidae]